MIFVLKLRYKLYFLLLVDIILCDKLNVIPVTPKIEGKIVGGESVSIEKYPFGAIIFNYGVLCGGSILTSWTVLTAAHCFDIHDDEREISVHVGVKYIYDVNAVVHYVKYLEKHADYNRAMPFACDIAILFVEKSFKFGPRVQRSIVVDTDTWMKKGQKHFTVTGWGTIKYDGPVSDLGLLMAQLEFIPRDECSRMHDMNFTEDMFCLYGGGTKDTCKGDSGGGVLWNDMLVGIVSHGDRCGEIKKPSVYCNVYYFRQWIYDKINDYYTENCKTLPST